MRRFSFGLTDRGAIHRFRAVGKVGIGGDHVVVVVTSASNRQANAERVAIDLRPRLRACGRRAQPPAQLALYQGTDREKVLIDGAKREGQLTLYTSHTWFRTFVKEFENKYPFVRASEWRNDSKNVIGKILEEVKAGRVLAAS